jgi:general secretion pathway protein E
VEGATAGAAGFPDAQSSQGFGRYLVEIGKLSAPALERAQSLSQESGEASEFVMTKLGLISERDLAEALAKFLHLPLLALRDYPDAPLLDERFSRRFLKEMHVIPLEDRVQALAIAIVNPLDSYAIDAVRFAAGKPVLCHVTYPADFDAAYERLYGAGKSELDEISASASVRITDTTADDAERLKDIASEAPVIRLVNLLITRAVEARASDIHIEPLDGDLRVRYRIDGVLQAAESPPQRLSQAVISRIKIMARLNIAERRLAQDGRIRLAIRGKDIDFRVSTAPTMHGESVVLRILDRGSSTFDFSSLGLDDDLIANFRNITGQPHGIVLVTGPTGSGKTTTLYTALLELNTAERKILTIEDPVEYQLHGVNQVQVKPQIGLTFANALRSFLRQDPDVMMVGEIRDLETAQIAVQAALTGHLILSTLHTNYAASAITRLLDMGVEDYLLTSTINGLAAQRLVRRLCLHCREPYAALPELIERLQLPVGAAAAPVTLYRARGCENCSGSGYRGRSAIFEVLPMSDAIRQAVLKRSEAGAIKAIAVAQGMRTMQTHGLTKALAGETSVEEVIRITRML